NTNTHDRGGDSRHRGFGRTRSAANGVRFAQPVHHGRDIGWCGSTDRCGDRISFSRDAKRSADGGTVGNPEPVNVTPEPQDSLPVTVIEPRTGWGRVNFRELWRYRELLFFLAWRDVKIRY